MARKLTKNDNLVYDYLINNPAAHDIPRISEEVKLSQIKVLCSLKRLLAHVVIRRINSTYQVI